MKYTFYSSKNSISFSADISHEKIYLDSTVSLEEVLISNLIENAILHIPKDSTIEIKICNSPNNTGVCVELYF